MIDISFFSYSDYIKELLTEGNKKFLVFAHHKVMLDKVSSTCEKLKTM